MDLHECGLAHRCEGSHRCELACPGIETRPRPDLTQRVSPGRIGEERELFLHSLERRLGGTVVQFLDNAVAAALPFVRRLGLSRCGRSREQQHDSNGTRMKREGHGGGSHIVAVGRTTISLTSTSSGCSIA